MYIYIYTYNVVSTTLYRVALDVRVRAQVLGADGPRHSGHIKLHNT